MGLSLTPRATILVMTCKTILPVFLVLFTTFFVYQNVLFAQSTLDIASSKRLSEYEKMYPVTLTQEEAQDVTERCLTVQKKILEAKSRVDDSIISREASYGNIEKKLASIQSRLAKQHLDTSVIDLMLASYRIEVSNFKLNAESYSTVLTDASTIDCQNNPSLFKASILAAREARSKTVQSVKDIRDLYGSSLLDGFKLLETQLYERNQ